MNVFESKSYKSYIGNKIQENGELVGYKTRLATAAGCKLSYLSQVLNGPLHLTPEHAAGLTTYWGLNKLESQYFLELLNKERAGTALLREKIDERLSDLKAQHENISGRLKSDRLHETEAQRIYYSSWHYSAIHILLTVQGCQSLQNISFKLHLSLDTVERALNHLEHMGLAKQNKGNWKAISFDIHLPADSPMTLSNHTNWRDRALLDVVKKNKNSLHYTGVHSLSQKDYHQLKGQLLKFLEEARSRIRNSPAEELVCLNVDLFSV